MIFIQSLTLVWFICNFEIFSFVIKIANAVNRAVLFVAILSTFVFNNDDVDVVFAEPDPPNWKINDES